MKNKIALLVILLAASPAFAAPPSSAVKYSAAYISQNLKKDVTTKAEVLQRFGKPTRVEQRAESDGIREIWNYNAYEESARGKFGKLSGFANRLLGALPNGAAAREGYEALGKAQTAVADVEGVGQVVTGPVQTTKAITIEFRDDVVRYFTN